MTAAGISLPGEPSALDVALPDTGGMRGVYEAELQKLLAQTATRLLAVICLFGPFAFAAVLNVQSGTPSDALFGFWVHSSGFAISLVVLGFAGSWGFPLLAGVLAGDLFSSEDRYGTWKTILTRSCTREDLFAGKVLAAMTCAAGLLAVIALSSLAGVVGPLLVALLTQLLDLIGKGVFMHMLLIGSAFDGWHGLFTTHRFAGPLLVSSIVCVGWIAVCLGASWAILRRRDFLGVAGARRTGWIRALRIVVAAAVLITVLALAGNLGPTGITAARLRAASATEFSNLTLYQQQLLGRAVPAGARLQITPTCNRHAAKPVGPGDWACTFAVYLPQPGSVPFQLSQVEYDVSVQYNGCYKAQSPPAFVGAQTMRDAHGRSVANPLFIVYGCFNTL